jgi:glutaminyl-peptide cyclotransferase
MNRTKQIIIVAIILSLVLAYVLIPLLKSDSSNEDLDKSFMARFSFEKNLATQIGNVIPLTFKVNNDDILKVELFFQDSLIDTWKKPKGELKHQLNSTNFNLGSYQINLKTTLKNGDDFNDVRLLRILSDISPVPLKARIIKSYPHNVSHFTQGLEFDNGILFEGTGDPNKLGATKIMQTNLQNGSILKEIGLNGDYFGEGITILGNKLYQLTYTEGKCFVYDKNSLQMIKDFSYNGEGWGICNDGKNLIVSNGTEYLTFRNPETFQTTKTIQVYDQVGPRVRINELEYVDGKIYANVWMLDMILVIDPTTGKVLNEIDCSEITKVGKGSGDVLNGIAYNTANKKFYLTGKYWANIYEVEFE